MFATATTAPRLDAGLDLDRLVQDHRAALACVLPQLDGVRRDVEARLGHDPVEHVSWRVKAPESILAKARRKRIPVCEEWLRREMFDLAGLRLVCAFLSDLRGVRDALVSLPGVVLLDERDYVARPKASGYRSLHLIIQVPATRADGGVGVIVEIQLRTVAMTSGPAWSTGSPTATPARLRCGLPRPCGERQS